MSRFQTSTAQIVGDRSRQEDAFGVYEVDGALGGGVLAVVCDGMGGHGGGDVASRLCVKAFERTFSQPTSDDPAAVLRAGLEAAHTAVREAAENGEGHADMGATAVAVFARGQDIWWISVGDSLLLLAHKKTITRLNADHSMAAVLDELAAVGRITEREAKDDPQRSALRSAVSASDIELIDEGARQGVVTGGALLVLASDGVLSLPEKTFDRTLIAQLKGDVRSSAERLVRHVEKQRSPGQDNTTVVVLEGDGGGSFLQRLFR